MKIKHKLGILFSLLLLIPVSAVVVVAVTWSSENFEKSALNNLKSAVQLSAQKLSTELTVAKEVLGIYVHSDPIQSLDPHSFLPYLKSEIERLAPRYEKFILGLPDGSFYNTASGNPSQGMRRSFDDGIPNAPLHNIIKRDYWQATIGSNPGALDINFVSQPMISHTSGQRQVVVAKTILTDNKVTGLLALTLNWEDIEAYVVQLRDEYFSEFDWPTRLVLTDRDGNYWYHWHQEKIVQHLTDENGQPVIDNTSQTMSLISNIKDENITELSTLYSKPFNLGVSVLPFRTHQSKNNFYFIYQIIPDSNYVFGVMVSRNELLLPLQHLREKYIWLLLLVLLIGTGTGLYMAASISAPVEELTQAVEALSEGKMLPIAMDKGAEEVQLLGQAFDKMRGKLRQRETELAASESRFNYAMIGANDGLWDWNLQTDDVFYSPRWITMLGYEPENFIHKTSSYFELVHPDDLELSKQHAIDYIAGRKNAFRMILRLKHKEGFFVYVLSRAFAVRDEVTGRVIRMVGTHVDISEQVAFEQRIQALNNNLEKRVADRTQDLKIAMDAALKAQAQAEEANHAKSRFLASMSHELRTPLNSINGFAERLVKRLEGKIESRHMDALKTIDKNGRQLLNIINDILDTQRIDSGDVTLKYSQVLIPELFDQLIRLYQEEAEKKGIRLHCQYSTNIDDRCIYADPVRIKQILENLLSNALKFTEQGDICLHASVALHNHKTGMRFDVIDTGLGVETSQLDMLFKPFTHADESQNRTTTGTGLGLTLVKLLTEMHNGVVSASSEPGKGSTFSVWIPSEKP